MNDSLAATLHRLLQSGTTTNPALNQLLHSYAEFHAVLAAVGGLFAAILVLIAARCLLRLRTAPRGETSRWTFERGVLLSFGVLTTIVAALLILIVAVNIDNAAHPRSGFADSVPMLGFLAPGDVFYPLHHAFTAWLQSGSTHEPSLVREKVHQRLSWQRPKAIVCAALLVLLTWVDGRVWGALIARSKSPHLRLHSAGGRTLLGTGVVSTIACLLLMLMVLGNTQAAIAPLSMTLFYG